MPGRAYSRPLVSRPQVWPFRAGHASPVSLASLLDCPAEREAPRRRIMMRDKLWSSEFHLLLSTQDRTTLDDPGIPRFAVSERDRWITREGAETLVAGSAIFGRGVPREGGRKHLRLALDSCRQRQNSVLRRVLSAGPMALGRSALTESRLCRASKRW